LSPFHIALAQINPVVGDLSGNAKLIADAAAVAHRSGAKLLITPELALTGYPPEDLLLRPAFIEASADALDQLRSTLAAYPGLAVVVGHPLKTPQGLHNSASVLRDGKCIASYAKHELPNNEVFDEVRYFTPGSAPCVFDVEGCAIGVIICEDAWHTGPAAQAKAAGAQLLISLNASPYHLHKENLRLEVLRKVIGATGLPLIYVNAVGGQDELVFDGGSFVLDANGLVATAMPQFESGIGLVAIDQNGEPKLGVIAPSQSMESQAYAALVLGVRDYVHKNGFPGVIIGLSGGVDSALVLAIAVDALGAEQVRAVMMQSPYTAEISWVDARALASNLGVQYDEIPIGSAVAALEGALAGQFAGLAPRYHRREHSSACAWHPVNGAVQ
jgi:NAD+ synthase (glutamine-hydrolysing)